NSNNSNSNNSNSNNSNSNNSNSNNSNSNNSNSNNCSNSNNSNSNNCSNSSSSSSSNNDSSNSETLFHDCNDSSILNDDNMNDLKENDIKNETFRTVHVTNFTNYTEQNINPYLHISKDKNKTNNDFIICLKKEKNEEDDAEDDEEGEGKGEGEGEGEVRGEWSKKIKGKNDIYIKVLGEIKVKRNTMLSEIKHHIDLELLDKYMELKTLNKVNFIKPPDDSKSNYSIYLNAFSEKIKESKFNEMSTLHLDYIDNTNFAELDILQSFELKKLLFIKYEE
ncbi:conserved protein, unknown function, partial [Hepatocystis sp. ex Piliocolobus tephrosceles]